MNKIWSHLYRTKLYENKFDLTREDIIKIMDRDKVCVYCGANTKLSLDHIIPITKGGDTTYLNMVLACMTCNSSKHNKDVVEWCEIKGYKIPEIINLCLIKN